MVARNGEFTIRVTFDRRDGGGLRAWSTDAPGLVLSNSDPVAMVDDLTPAVEIIVGERLGYPVRVRAVKALSQREDAPPSRIGRAALTCMRHIGEPAAASI